MAAPQWRFAGCRDVADMLGRMPLELDKAIVAHASKLTLFLHGRLAGPISFQDLVLLWCECVIDNHLAAAPMLPQIYSMRLDFLSWSVEVTVMLRHRAEGGRMLYKHPASSPLQPTWIQDPVDVCPEPGPLLLPHFQRTLTALIDTTPDDDRQMFTTCIGKHCISVANRLGHTNVVRKMLDVALLHDLSVWSAVLANNGDLVEMLVSRATTRIITDQDIYTALKRNYNDLALRLIQMRAGYDDGELCDELTNCISHGKTEVLQAIVTPKRLRTRLVRAAVAEAAESGRLEIIKFVYEMSYMAHWDDEALKMAIENDWHDVARWLVEEPAARSTSPAVIKAILESSEAITDMLFQAWPCRAADIMDTAAARGRLDLVQHMHECGFSCTTKALDAAAENRNTDVARFLHENRTEGCSHVSLAWALAKSDGETLGMLLDGPIEDSFQGVSNVIEPNPSAKAIRILHHGVD
ncbi:hypothetical protein HK105_201084 [Polyrhizophydium stewartii]|uniref:Ankyrin repeat protein n=1 Tax=Polyrhizophydium stewartii TaxID=2732419 RepID=A0ABR4NIZ3_9FUNG